MDRILTISGVVAAIAIVAILVAILGNVFGVFSFGSKKVTMINVVGTQYEEALKQLEDLGLSEKNVVVSTETSDETEGIVINQSVAEGKEFSLNDTLRLTVAGKDEAEDKSDSSSSAEANTKVEEEEEGTVSVPTVIGLSQAEATKLLDEKGIVVTSTTQEYSDEVASGSVISQSISAGEEVAKNSSITLVISKGKKEVTYSYSIANPYDGECKYEIVELGKSGTIPKNGSINISEVKVATLTVKLTYTPTFTTEDGTTINLDDKTESSTQTVQGTAN